VVQRSLIDITRTSQLLHSACETMSLLSVALYPSTIYKNIFFTCPFFFFAWCTGKKYNEITYIEILQHVYNLPLLLVVQTLYVCTYVCASLHKMKSCMSVQCHGCVASWPLMSTQHLKIYTPL